MADDSDVYGDAEGWEDTASWPEDEADDPNTGPTRPTARRRRLILSIRWRPLLKRVSGRIAVIWIVLAVMSVQAEMVVKGGLLDDPAARLFRQAGGVVERVRYGAWVELHDVTTSHPPAALDLLSERVVAWMGASDSNGPDTGLAPLPDGWLLRVWDGKDVGVSGSEFGTIDLNLQRARGEFLAALAAGQRAMAAFPEATRGALDHLSPRRWGAVLSGTMVPEGTELLRSVERVKAWAAPLFRDVGGELVGVEWTPDEVRVFGITHRLPSRLPANAGGGGGRSPRNSSAGSSPKANLEMRLAPSDGGAVAITVLTRPELP